MRRRIAISALSLLALATIGCGQATPSPTTAPVATVSAAEPTPWTVSTGRHLAGYGGLLFHRGAFGRLRLSPNPPKDGLGDSP